MNRTQILGIVKDHINLIVDHDEIKEDESLHGLGLDSLDQVELFMMLEKEFKIEIPDSDLSKIHSVGDVADAVQKYLKLI